MTLTVLYNAGPIEEKRPLYSEKDYTSEFGILKDFTSDDILERVKFFIPHWINTESGTDTEILISSIVDFDNLLSLGTETGHTGIKYLYDRLKELIRDCYLGSAIGKGLYNLGLDYAKIYPRSNEHDWHYRYRIYEMLYEMTPTRGNLERLVVKWIGNHSDTKLGIASVYDNTIQRYELPETFHYIKTSNFFKYLYVYKNGELLNRDLDYEEIGKIDRKTRYIDFIRPIYSNDVITVVLKKHDPYKKLTLNNNNFEIIRRYKFITPKYIVGESEDINLNVYKNNIMLRRFDNYLEIGTEGSISSHIYVYNEPLDIDLFKFVVLGYYNSDGVHMVETKHHVLEQKDYGFYSGASYICSFDETSIVQDLSDYLFWDEKNWDEYQWADSSPIYMNWGDSGNFLNMYPKVGDMVYFDVEKLTFIFANAHSDTLQEANGIVTAVVGSGENTKYIIQCRQYFTNRQKDDYGNYIWNFTPGATLYLNIVNGGITEASPSSPHLVQVIGEAITCNKILLSSLLNPSAASMNIFFNSPTGKYNKNSTIYIVIKNALNFGADFSNYDPDTAFCNVKDSYMLDKSQNFQPGVGFFGVSNTIEYNGVVKNSDLYNLMKEIDYCKPVGAKIIFELHPKELRYGRDLRRTGK